MTTVQNPALTQTQYTDITWQSFTGQLFAVKDGLDISYDDVNQGELGNCYFLAALSELAQHDANHIRELVRQNGDNTYTFNGIGSLGSFSMDNQLPVRPGYSQYYASYQSDGWVALLEKAYAYVNSRQDLQGPSIFNGSNSYATIELGYGAGALTDLTGASNHFINISDASDQQIIDALTANRPTIFGTLGEDKKKTVEGNITLNHAYSVLGYQSSTNTYRFYNPWGIGNSTDEGFINLTLEQIRQYGSNISWIETTGFNLSPDGDISSILEAPTQTIVYGLPQELNINNGLVINQAWAKDPNGWQDIRTIDFWFEDRWGNRFELKDAEQFSPWSESALWAEGNEVTFAWWELSSLQDGVYTFYAQPRDRVGLVDSKFSQSIQIAHNTEPGGILIYEIPDTVNEAQNLTINQIWTTDPDGWYDISHIDYWMLDAQENIVELSDSTVFFPWESSDKWAGTSSISFTPEEFAVLGSGQYTFYAQTVDKSGRRSEKYEHQIVVEAATEPDNLLNVLQYGASHEDLIQAFGFNLEAFQQHYETWGRFEGRSPDKFDEFRYIASNNDLIGAFGLNGEAATIHYITYGFSEGRSLKAFDAACYLDSYDDLRNSLGTDLQAATKHYITYGLAEGRNPNLFPSDRYLASYGDLIQAFGYNLEAGSSHYLFSGIGEGRGVSFDPQSYLNLYSDLQAAFGNNLEAATRHYIEYGFAEGRAS